MSCPKTIRRVYVSFKKILSRPVNGYAEVPIEVVSPIFDKWMKDKIINARNEIVANRKAAKE